MKRRTSVYMETDFLKKLANRAEQNGRSMSGEITFILKNALNNEEILEEAETSSE